MLYGKTFKTLCVAALLTATVSHTAMAQAVPGSADSSRVQKRVKMDKLPNMTGEKVVSVPDHIVTSAPAGADKQKLTLTEVVVDGMTAYPETVLADMYQGMLGNSVSLADVFGLAERLTVKYRNDGYILSQVIVPPQEISAGKVRLQVIEGVIDNITIDGAPSERVHKMMTRMAQQLAKRAPLNTKDLERYLLLMNDLSGYTVKSVLSPSPNKHGAADMTLLVTHKPYEVMTSIDNRGSRFLGPLQLSVAGRLNSFLGRGESIDLQIVTAPDNNPSRELDYLSLAYGETINKNGTRLNVGLSVTETQPGFTLKAFDVEGKSHNWYMELVHPVIRSRTQNLFISAKLDITDITRTDNITPGRIEDRLRVARLGGTYQFTDKYVGINTVDMTLSQGLNILNAREAGAPNLTRARGDQKFTKVEAEFSRLQHVTNNISLLGSVAGQKSNHILLSSEEFGVGGSNYGRAYDGSEIVGESGLAAKIELQIDNPVQAPVINGYQLFGYYDIGKVWDRDNAVVKDRQRSIASAGAGVRFDLTDNISGSAEVAFPLTRDVEVNADKDPRGFFSMSGAF